VITTIRRDALQQLERVASMNSEGRLQLPAHLFRFFTRRTLPPDWVDWPEDEEREPLDRQAEGDDT
jgi:hypothetical protein